MASPGSSSRHMPKFNVSPSASPREEHYYLSKKPRNYKYWSDEEIKKILSWLTLPENEGKLTRNKAQACREVAKTLFDGDEYMAISVRSKLMSLEKLYKEAEQIKALPANTYNNTKEELLNQGKLFIACCFPKTHFSKLDKIKEISKFYKECKQLFSKSDASLNHNSSPTPTPASPINKHLLRPEYDLPPIHDHELHHKSWYLSDIVFPINRIALTCFT